MNLVVLKGNLTRDVEVKSLENGSTVGNVGLAINKKYKVGDEVKEQVTFVDLEIWGKRAEVLAKYTKKGSPILVRGSLRLQTWETEGQKRSKLSVVIEDFEFLSGGSNGSSSEETTEAATSSSSSSTNSAVADEAMVDDIPF